MKPAVSAARSDRRAGFTLLEALAAIAIAAAAFAVIVDFSMRTLRNWHRGDQAIAAMEMITRGIARLQADLSVSLPMSVPGGDGAAVFFKGDAGSLVFVAATGFGTGNRGMELISVAAVPDREEVVLMRNRGPVANPQPQLRDPVALMKGRMQIRFSYRDRNGRTTASWVEQRELPAAVALEIFGEHGNPILPVPALIRLPQNYSVECLDPPGNQANIQVRCAGDSGEAGSASGTGLARRRR